MLCRDYVSCKSDFFLVKIWFYIWTVFRKRPLFCHIQICSLHVSSDVIMVKYVLKFQSNRVNFVSSRRFLNCDYVTYYRCFFLCHVIFFWHFLDGPRIHVEGGEIFTHLERERERESIRVAESRKYRAK